MTYRPLMYLTTALVLLAPTAYAQDAAAPQVVEQEQGLQQPPAGDPASEATAGGEAAPAGGSAEEIAAETGVEPPADGAVANPEATAEAAGEPDSPDAELRAQAETYLENRGAGVQRVADEFVDWGSSEPVGQPVEQQYVRGYQVVARAFRDHRSAAVAATLVGVWVVIVAIADNPAVTVIVSALLGLVAGYLTTWPRVQSRRARRAARNAELAARADRQHQLYMRDPAAYLRRIEKGETP